MHTLKRFLPFSVIIRYFSAVCNFGAYAFYKGRYTKFKKYFLEGVLIDF